MYERVKSRRRRKVGAIAMAICMVVETVGPAHAVVSQLPGLYSTPPDTNVMFTLDDSGSMQADAIPDYSLPSVNYTGVPNNSSSAYFNSARGVAYPNMWGSGSSYLSISLYRSNNAIARYMRSSDGNPLYYDPKVTYLPWPQAGNNSARMANANPAAVNIDTDDPTDTSYTLNLNQRQGTAGDETVGYWRATYYVYTGTQVLPYATPNHAQNTASNFTKYEIQGTGTATFPKAATRTDCVSLANACSRVEEMQNFANWLQYYRNRRLMAKGGVANAFAVLGTNLRAGFARINGSPVIRRGVRPFTGADRTGFFNLLYYEPSGNGLTPLRKAMDDVGQHFTTSDANSPWAQNPGTSVGTEYACRRNFHFLSTDGFWNSSAASNSAARANNDNFTGSTPAKPDGTTYTFADTATSVNDPLVGRYTINPFADNNSDTLSDVAAYYWRTDLRPTLQNTVTPSERDPAFWQHLSTFTIGLGIDGSNTVRRTSDNSLTVPAVPVGHPLYPYIGSPWLADQPVRDWLIANKVPMTWSAPAADNAATGDDLIHASMNGRGRYLSATNPTQLATSLASALAEATDNPGSLASVVTEAPQVSTDTEVYQATYNPARWAGRLYAFSQSANGSVNTTPSTALWEASNKMPAPAARNIFTWNPITRAGVTFTWGALTATQQADLSNDATLLDFLRGSDAREVAQGGPFRDRSRYTIGAVKGGVLGDVVNGSPIKGPSAGGGYERLPPGSPGQASYATFRSTGNTALDNMRNTIFLGANDGMLHAFDRLTGVERFAFVPNSVYSVPRSLTGIEKKLRMLSDPGYTHRFTVDGPPQIADAFIGASAAASSWTTVLLGSTGAGARSVFAMDITDPAVGAAAFGAGKLLWEFSEADNADMGYVISYPHIARMRNGSWVAIFGNGYDSANGRAKLFVLDLQTGAVLWEQGVGPAGGNGLSQPNFVVNAMREVTAIYAGDLLGNLWKFDVDDANPSNWKVAFGGAPNYTPLFAGSATQPITVMPEITFHPNGGTLVSFGTGKLFETEDTSTSAAVNVNLNTQAIYGIWDKPGELTGFSGNASLVQQSMNTALAVATDTTVTGTTTNAIDWGTRRGWYLNLASGGERVNVNPRQSKSTLLVVANTPDTDPCRSGGSSRIFGLDPITGGAPNFGVFDANASGGINNSDRGYNVKSISFAVLSLPTLQSKKPFTDAIVTERVGTRGQTGERLGGVENKPANATDCAQWLLAGGSDTSIAGFDIALCSGNKPRISWRQLQ